MARHRAVVFAAFLSFAALGLAPTVEAAKRPRWLVSARVLVRGDPGNTDCRTGVCKHNENTDLTRCGGSSSVTASTTRPPTRTAIRRSCLSLERRSRMEAWPADLRGVGGHAARGRARVPSERQADAGARAYGRNRCRAVRKPGTAADQGLLGEAAVSELQMPAGGERGAAGRAGSERRRHLLCGSRPARRRSARTPPRCRPCPPSGCRAGPS